MHDMLYSSIALKTGTWDAKRWYHCYVRLAQAVKRPSELLQHFCEYFIFPRFLYTVKIITYKTMILPVICTCLKLDLRL